MKPAHNLIIVILTFTSIGLLLESTIAEIFTDQFNPENNFALKTVTVSVGRSLKLFCSDGNAVDNDALYAWFRNGIQIAQLKHSKTQNTNGFSYFEGINRTLFVLNIKAVEPNDFGIYECRIDCSDFKASYNITIEVELNDDFKIKDIHSSYTLDKSRTYLQVLLTWEKPQRMIGGTYTLWKSLSEDGQHLEEHSPIFSTAILANSQQNATSVIDGNRTLQKIEGIQTNSYLLLDWSCDQTIHFKMAVANNVNGRVLYSPLTDIYTIKKYNPDRIVNVKTHSLILRDTVGLIVQWDVSIEERMLITHFDILYRKKLDNNLDDSNEWILHKHSDPSQTKVEICDLQAKSEYYIKLRAATGNCTGEWSEVITTDKTIDESQGPVIKNVELVTYPKIPNKITVKWQLLDNKGLADGFQARGYNIMLQLLGSSDIQEINVSAFTREMNFEGLEFDGEYTASVAVLTQLGKGSYCCNSKVKLPDSTSFKVRKIQSVYLLDQKKNYLQFLLKWENPTIKAKGKYTVWQSSNEKALSLENFDKSNGTFLASNDFNITFKAEFSSNPFYVMESWICSVQYYARVAIMTDGKLQSPLSPLFSLDVYYPEEVVDISFESTITSSKPALILNWKYSQVQFPNLINEVEIQYRVVIEEDVDQGNNWNTLLYDNPSQATFTLPDLEPSSQYYVRIRTKSGACIGEWSAAKLSKKTISASSGPVLEDVSLGLSKLLPNAINVKWVPVKSTSNHNENLHTRGYRIKYSLVNSSEYETIDVPLRKHEIEIENLQLEGEYVVLVSIRNQLGIGNYSCAGDPIKLPGLSNIYIPQGVEARPVANEIAVIIKWSGIVKNSIDLTGFDTIGYRIKFRNLNDSRESEITVDSASKQIYSLKISELEPASVYQFAVATVTTFGTGRYCCEAEGERILVQTFKAPEKINNIEYEVIADNGITLKVVWTEPVSDSVVKSYEILAKLITDEGKEVIIENKNITKTLYTASNVEPGSLYSFQVAAISNIGIGPFSESVMIQMPKVPAEVKDIRTEIKFDDTVQYSIYNTFIQVTWEEAESDYPIIEYEVKWRRENSDFKTLKVTGQTFCNFKGHSILRRSPSLNFTVKAISKVGAGPASEEVYFKIPIGPQRIKEIRTDTTIEEYSNGVVYPLICLQWDRPDSDIEHIAYRITYSWENLIITKKTGKKSRNRKHIETQTVYVSETSYCLSSDELKMGIHYTVSVIAISPVGNSEPSEAVKVQFPSIEDAPVPSNFTAKPLPIRGLAQFKWQAPKPSKLGFKVKGYLIKCKAGKREKLERVPVNQTSTIIKGLYPGLRYVVSVASITQMGIGPFCCQKSDFVVLHTHGAPHTPNYKDMEIQIVNGTAGLINVTWKRPASTLDITRYRIKLLDSFKDWRYSNLLEFEAVSESLVLNIKAARRYSLVLQAVNEIGIGRNSKPLSFMLIFTKVLLIA